MGSHRSWVAHSSPYGFSRRLECDVAIVEVFEEISTYVAPWKGFNDHNRTLQPHVHQSLIFNAISGRENRSEEEFC